MDGRSSMHAQRTKGSIRSKITLDKNESDKINTCKHLRNNQGPTGSVAQGSKATIAV